MRGSRVSTPSVLVPVASLMLGLGCLAVGSPGDGTELTPGDDPRSTPVVPAATGTATTPLPKATSATGSPFSVIARGGAAFRLHRLVDGDLLVSTGPLVMRVDASGEVLYDPTMLRGITPIRDAAVAVGSFDGVSEWTPVGLGGRWPDALFMSLDFSSGFRGEGGRPITYRHTPHGWTRLKTRGASFEHHLVALHPWIDGSVLAQRGYVSWFPGQERWVGDDEHGPTAQQVEAAVRAIAAAKKLVVVRGTPKAPRVGPSLATFASRPSGEVIAVTGGASASAILIASDGTRTTLALPGEPSPVEGVVLDGPDRAWVFGTQEPDDTHRPYLARIEGGRVTATEPPPCKSAGLRSFVALPDGTLWTTCADPLGYGVYNDHELWTRPEGGAWMAVALPEGVDVPTEVHARAKDDVWVAASMGDQAVLLHTRPRDRVLELPDLEGIGRLLHEYNDLLPLTRNCVVGYVPLTAPPFDANAIRERLAADLGTLSRRATIHLVRTTIGGAEQLGLRVAVDADDIAADTKALHALVRARLGADAVTPARCWEPTVADDGTLGEWEKPRAN